MGLVSFLIRRGHHCLRITHQRIEISKPGESHLASRVLEIRSFGEVGTETRHAMDVLNGGMSFVGQNDPTKGIDSYIYLDYGTLLALVSTGGYGCRREHKCSVT